MFPPVANLLIIQVVFMKIFVKVKTGGRAEKVEDLGDGHFQVTVTARPVRDRANRAVILALARHFTVSLSQVSLISGRTGRYKVAEIN